MLGVVLGVKRIGGGAALLDPSRCVPLLLGAALLVAASYAASAAASTR